MQKRLNRSISRLDCGLGWVEGSTSSSVFARWCQCAQVQSFSFLPGGANVADNTLPRALQKWLNQSICHLGCGLAWTEGSTSSIVFASWRQCALIGGIRLRGLSAAGCGLVSNYFDHLLFIIQSLTSECIARQPDEDSTFVFVSIFVWRLLLCLHL